ncbi:carboxymuconolactone decarboxylase family protein [Bacillus thermotolerans]|uniref:Carboxymuconolactone decarboxylase family protein n=1 Tax=Bacillus thermotolerans TaxID=1221996 RepID=A0A0F5HX90_BACTR|nr:carboxymuconolactone decarboxylase family protein [Bacillus thermotolerans]KKB34473.1 putative carboxymuconolactone decarboxylase family protein [Bacillus thermotolerans]KKB37746.1 putative carboxymuconolactone decarboxylase family protein [Bacillus thermotolerans]KKB37853.1 putative carboxymuconolactone decarboxylase family protein [Bacillus thermotolerans]
MENNSLYQKSYFRRLPELAELAPDTFKAFAQFDKLALSDGLLTKKTKELIAVAVAHVTGCPYCIDLHVTNAKKLEVSKEEMAEAIMVATALKAGSAMAHGLNALQAFDGENNEDLYQKSNLSRFKEFTELSPDGFHGFNQFDQAAMKPGLISGKDKELIAIAVAHVTGCPYCIEIHTKNAKKLGVSREELAESILVATALKAGSAIAHSVNALNAYDS